MIVYIPVKLTGREISKFSQFYVAHNGWVNHGSQKGNEIANKLKPFIDDNWDKYQAWKAEVNKALDISN